MAARLVVTRERRAGETRAALTPETAKKLIGLGFSVAVEAGTGQGSSIPDSEYAAAGAEVVASADAALGSADVVLQVRPPEPAQVAAMRQGAILAAVLNPYGERALVDALAQKG